MDALEIANILATELWCHHQLASLEGLNSGVPTRTTATLTPTHLRNIEQTFIELQCRSDSAATAHVGFVPPPIAAQVDTYGILSGSTYGAMCGAGDAGATLPLHVSPGPGSSGDSSSCSLPPAPKRRNMGGRRPAKTPVDLSPEEEERRKVRRERNKMAAARCRKRRLDHTNELVEETEGLERRKQELQDEIRELNESCRQLQSVLESHRPCRRSAATPPDVKPYGLLERRVPAPCPAPLPAPAPAPALVTVKLESDELDPAAIDADIFTSPQSKQRTMLSAAAPAESLQTPPARARPSFLHVPTLAFTPGQLHARKAGTAAELAGVDISTPSSALPFNFDSLMEGGTGLTPVQPCASQHKALPDMGEADCPQTNKLVSL